MLTLLSFTCFVVVGVSLQQSVLKLSWSELSLSWSSSAGYSGGYSVMLLDNSDCWRDVSHVGMHAPAAPSSFCSLQ